MECLAERGCGEGEAGGLRNCGSGEDFEAARAGLRGLHLFGLFLLRATGVGAGCGSEVF